MPIRPKLHTFLGCAALVALVFAVYGQVARHEFVDYDTQDYVTENPRILAGLSWEGVRWAFTSSFAANWFPLTWISHMLDVELFGVRPGAHHLVNVGLHALSAVVLFLAWLAMTSEWTKSWFVAAVFALHPLHVESVAWIVERKDVLSTLFGWSCLLAYARYAAHPSARRYCAALVCLALGLMSKPMLVTWPAVLLLLDVWPLARRAVGWKRLVIEKLPFLALSVASAIVTVWAQSAGGAVQRLDQLPLSARLANAPVAVMRYLGSAFWPSHLAFYYPHPREGLAPVEVALALALIAGISIAAIALRRRAPYVGVGWCVFLGTLVPVIGLVQVGGQALADRYMYVPLLGVSIIVAWGVPDLVARWPGRRTVLGIAGAAAVIALAFGAWFQTAVWRNTQSLCEHALAVTQANHVAHDVLAISLVKHGEIDAAVAHLHEALRLDSGDLDALANLAGALVRQNKPQEAEIHARRALALAPDRAKLHAALGASLLAQGRFEEARVELEQALSLDGGIASAHGNLAAALEALERPLEAQAAYARALRLRPDFTTARLGLARLYAQSGELARADAEYALVLRHEPAQPDALRGLARVRVTEQRPREALALLETALRAHPDWPLAMADVAWILAAETDPKLRDVRRAVELAERASATSQERVPAVLDALALAYAADGRFEEAIAAATKAVARTHESGERELAGKIARRLESYRGRRIDRVTPR